MNDAVEIVTLENLGQKIPRWDPGSPNQLYAVVDMGSNGIRFSISDLSPPRARLLKCIYRERAAISLFDALSGPSSSASTVQSLVFPDETIRLVSQTLARFRAIAIDDYGVLPEQVTVFATEAMRRAQNAAAMLDAIQAASPGLLVYILTPQVETLFGAVGARSGFVDVKGLFLDLGGGSVQMTYLDSHAARGGTPEDAFGYEAAAALAGQSLPFGAARLTRILEDADADIRATEISQLQSGLGEAFQTLCARFPTLASAATEAQEMKKSGHDDSVSGIDIYLYGGGFRGYGSMLMHNHPIHPYPIPSIASFTVPGKLFCRTKDMLKVNKSSDAKIFGMSKRRRAQFPAIVAVVEALIAAVPPIRSVTFCAGGNREGALMMKLPPEIREANPLVYSVTSVEGFALFPDRQPTNSQDVLDTLISAFPAGLDLAKTVTVFGLQLGNLYTSQIWSRLGEDADSNAAAALHHAMDCPSQPGLTHLARSVLGVTLCARWGANLAPIDQQLHRNLRALMDAVDPDAAFWADFTGAVTAAMAMAIRSYPKMRRTIKDIVRFRSTLENGKRVKISLEVAVAEETASGLDLDNLLGLFKKLEKQKHDGKRVAVTAAVGLHT